MIRKLLFFVFLPITLSAATFTTKEYTINPTLPIPISIEHATTSDQLAWGLMNRHHLTWGHGMLFHYSPPRTVSMWMLGVYIDLSIAFIDANKVIRQINELKAYPERIDPKRPLKEPKDLARYPSSDPISRMFARESTHAIVPVKYALEMNSLWFKQNGINIGDILFTKKKSSTAYIIPSISLDKYDPKPNEIILLKILGRVPRGVWLPKDGKGRDIAFLDEKFKIVKSGSLQGGVKFDPGREPVMFSGKPISYIVVMPAGWLKKHKLDLNALKNRL